MTTPEPLLELSEEEWKEIRLELASVQVCREDRGGESACATCENYERAVNYLLRVEAGRQRAEFLPEHELTGGYSDQVGICILCEANGEFDSRHGWTPADWLAHIRREKLGE